MTGGVCIMEKAQQKAVPPSALAGQALQQLRQPSCILVNLDAVRHNVQVLKGLAGPNTGIMGVVKGSAYGSGLLPVVEVLLEEGVQELSVATVGEGIHLRRHDVQVPITVLGNLLQFEVEDVLKHNLIPTISWASPLTAEPADSLKYPDGSCLRVAINIDTGMSRYGVQPQDLPALVTTLDNLNVTIASMYTHFQAAINEPEKNKKQLDMFLEATEPYKLRPLTRHVAATTGCVQGLGTDLDFIRPGGAITGLSSGSDEESAGLFAKCGFRPALSVVARPTFFKQLPPGRGIGYDATYQTTDDEWIANLTTGWSDGFSRRLSNTGAVKRVKTGELCPIVGRVSMDSITVRLPEAPAEDDVFQVISDDFDENTSAVGLARILEAAVYEMPGNWSTRLSRVYIKNGSIAKVYHSLDYTC
ncbi:alanine racemase-like [Portunus trituberculatus]|uniref:alanine racemase-like n=1 Tax=Portunus trituberculatus TaxID=210409 RepID=UPI001E1CCE0C|nr:alanine racemase-like [Portunus trituberculatus]XP_045114118.1 alanine racemase-like [Portunus trituberculatus]XP_045114119.1 alanine racemase-like [Portunus trituberculatus]XP_045114121.1 alanine racemase-like [Portunus trituberculatus]